MQILKYMKSNIPSGNATQAKIKRQHIIPSLGYYGEWEEKILTQTLLHNTNCQLL